MLMGTLFSMIGPPHTPGTPFSALGLRYFLRLCVNAQESGNYVLGDIATVDQSERVSFQQNPGVPSVLDPKCLEPEVVLI